MSLGTDILGIKMCSAEVLALLPAGAPALRGDCSLVICGVGVGVVAGAVHPRHSLPSTLLPLAVREWSGLLWAEPALTPECSRPGVFPLEEDVLV